MQKSPKLIETLKRIPINGNPLTLALIALSLDAILTLGDHEHANDWDPHLEIELTDGTKLTTPNGSTEIIFGDFNDDEQESALLHHQEITTFGIFINTNGTPSLHYYYVSHLKTLTVLTH